MHTLKDVLESFSVAALLACAIGTAQAAPLEFFGSRDTFGGPPAAPNPVRLRNSSATKSVSSIFPPAPESLTWALSHTRTVTASMSRRAISSTVCLIGISAPVTRSSVRSWGRSTLPPLNGVASFVETFTLTGGTGQYPGQHWRFPCDRLRHVPDQQLAPRLQRLDHDRARTGRYGAVDAGYFRSRHRASQIAIAVKAATRSIAGTGPQAMLPSLSIT